MKTLHQMNESMTKLRLAAIGEYNQEMMKKGNNKRITFVHNNTVIVDPTIGTCGQPIDDPIDHYGRKQIEELNEKFSKEVIQDMGYDEYKKLMNKVKA